MLLQLIFLLLTDSVYAENFDCDLLFNQKTTLTQKIPKKFKCSGIIEYFNDQDELVYSENSECWDYQVAKPATVFFNLRPTNISFSSYNQIQSIDSNHVYLINFKTGYYYSNESYMPFVDSLTYSSRLLFTRSNKKDVCIESDFSYEANSISRYQYKNQWVSKVKANFHVEL